MTLYEFRKSHNISIEELAGTLGVGYSYINNNGNKKIEELSSQLQASINLLIENKKLKEEIVFYKKMIRELKE